MEEERFTFFWNGPLSQWYIRDFTFKNVTYNCAEQYMMAHKAMQFSDEETLAKILSSKSPKEQKALGRQVKNFDSGVWDLISDTVVLNANYNKFKQNEDLKLILMNTRGTTLVEASPFDTIWGIGLSESDPRALNRATWRGQNKLGNVLTRLRIFFEEESL